MLMGQMAARAWLAFLRMNVAIGACHVHVAHEDELPAGALKSCRILIHRFEELHLCGEVLAAVGHVDRCDGELPDLYRRAPRFVVPGLMCERRPLRRERLLDVQGHPRVGLAAMPIAPV